VDSTPHHSTVPRAANASGSPAALSSTDFASMVTAVTSAFGDPTRRDIYLYVREAAEGVTATDVAEQFTLHPNVARHHLDKLAGGGYLDVEVSRGGKTGAGRPSKHYRVSAKSTQAGLPVRHDDLLITLLGRALARIPHHEAEAMAEEVGLEYGRLMASSLGADHAVSDTQRSFRSALHVVADALTAHGFAAHAEKHGNELRIVSEHCPFGDAAIENPVICAVDRGMVRGMLSAIYGETSTELSSSVALGDAVCVTAVEA